MGREINDCFAAYLLRKAPVGLTREEFYREAERVGWVKEGTRRQWAAKYIDPMFQDIGEKDLLFFFDGHRLKLQKRDVYPSGFGPIEIHNEITQRSPEMLNQVRESGKIYTPLELMAAMARSYEDESGRTLYELAVEEHRRNRLTPIPRDPNISPKAKYYEIEVDVSVGRITHDIPRSRRVVARKLKEAKESLRMYKPDSELAERAKSQVTMWEALYAKIEATIDALENQEPRRQIMELTSMNGPPVGDALEKALSEIIEELATTEDQNRMLAKLGFKGIRVDKSSSRTQLKGVVNLTKRWLDEEMRLFGGGL